MQAGPSDGPRLTRPPTQLGFTPQARASPEKLIVWGPEEDPTTLPITVLFFLFSSFENIFFQFMTYILIFFFLTSSSLLLRQRQEYFLWCLLIQQERRVTQREGRDSRRRVPDGARTPLGACRSPTAPPGRVTPGLCSSQKSGGPPAYGSTLPGKAESGKAGSEGGQNQAQLCCPKTRA